ncbi:bacteriocin-like protein [Chryseobacterium indologenes]|uniref:bacteriocin-like protein n=1 Tax=Chryseobacterium indologenes TaxID=253 RepID=UPI0016254D39|nr:hypothetical protein [Chryseobacterium indologenes]
MKNLKKLTRKELIGVFGGTQCEQSKGGFQCDDAGEVGRDWKCCKEFTDSPQYCGICGQTAYTKGYYAKYC